MINLKFSSSNSLKASIRFIIPNSLFKVPVYNTIFSCALSQDAIFVSLDIPSTIILAFFSISSGYCINFVSNTNLSKALTNFICFFPIYLLIFATIKLSFFLNPNSFGKSVITGHTFKFLNFFFN